MHEYQDEDIVTCLKNLKVIFIGDSTTRDLFWAMARKLGFNERGKQDKHADLSLRLREVVVDFIWDPYLNTSSLHREVNVALLTVEDLGAFEATAILVIGGGLWHARYLEEDYSSQYVTSLGQISSVVTTGHQVQQQNKHHAHPDHVPRPESLTVLAPVPIPVYTALSQVRAQTITPDKIDTLNSYLQQFSAVTRVPIVRSFTLMTALRQTAYQNDGIHIMEKVASAMVDVLLNARCNAILRRSQTNTYPMDKTCCNGYKIPGWTQSLFLDITLWSLPLFVLFNRKDNRQYSYLPSKKTARAMMILALAVCYCYYADRSQLFNKVQKHYQLTEFICLCMITFLLGVLSIHGTSTILQDKLESKNSPTQDQTFMPRDQTDEWKGWMQMLILIYHYTGASKVLWIYRIIRLLVASYLFMTGFGHTLYFYKKADYSLKRCAAVLIRLNMLSCILPYVMGTDYLFYYFAPLISFWYIVIYCTMGVGWQRNHDMGFLVSKIFISAVLVTFLTRSYVFFDTLFLILEKTCKIRWNLDEWHFRLNLDGFIVYVGMLCAIVNIRITKAFESNEPVRTSLDALISRHFYRMRFISATIAIMVLPIFFVVISEISTKQAYTSWIPYTSALPILCFVILRNISCHTRIFFSSIFAWVGRHSLETFTLQFHIWLAADTKGLLALGVVEGASGDAMSGRYLDLVVLTIVFLWVSWHVAAATQILTGSLVDSGNGADVEIGNDAIAFPPVDVWMRAEGSTKEVLNLFLRSVRRLQRTVARHLEIRLLIIFGMMWLLNVIDI